MIEMRIALDDRDIRRGFAVMPEAMERNLGRFLRRAALEVAREEGRAAPKAFSTLAASIRIEDVGPLHYAVATGTNYARSVEEGRAPGGMPGTANGLMEWVKQKTGLSGKPLDHATFAIARAIGRRGIKPQPYAEPTAEKMTPRVVDLAFQGVDAGLKEAFGS